MTTSKNVLGKDLQIGQDGYFGDDSIGKIISIRYTKKSAILTLTYMQFRGNEDRTFEFRGGLNNSYVVVEK